MDPTTEAILDDDGYTVLPGLLDLALLQRLDSELSAACRESAGAAMADCSCLQFPHLASGACRLALSAASLHALLAPRLGAALKLMQSILLVHGPGATGMNWHSDGQYLDCSGQPLFGVWIALDDATVDNGCLWVRPGSHGPALAGGRPACAGGGVALPVAAGTAIVLGGRAQHRSGPNRRAAGLRRALIGHFSRAGTPSFWDADNLQLPVPGGGSIEMVAGARALALKQGTLDP